MVGMSLMYVIGENFNENNPEYSQAQCKAIWWLVITVMK